MSASILYMTCADKGEAEKIVKALVTDRLIACANILSSHTSFYWWEGEVATGEEVAVIMKSRTELFEKIEKKVLALHSYDCPCLVSWSLEKGHDPFLNWIENETKL